MAGALVSSCSEQAGGSPGSGPGALVADAPLRLTGGSAALGDKAEVHYVAYGSTSGVDGSAALVSGIVFVPKGKPRPPEGYPLVSYGHGAVGFDSDCGPTMTKDLGLADTTRVSKLLDAGYVVAVSDYQGLGKGAEPEEGGAGLTHPFREPRTTGYNLIDAARAAKALLGRLGTALSGKWAVYGESQGGEAAWAAGDLAAGYGSGADGLTLIGVAAEKPPTDFTWLVDGAAAGTLGPGDQISYLRLLRGLSVAHPELRLDDYVRGPLADKANQKTILGCFARGGARIFSIAKLLGPADTRASAQQADQLRAWLKGWKLPLAAEKSSGAPFFVAASVQDEVVPVAAVRRGIAEEKERGTAVQEMVENGGKHREFDDSSEAIAWLGDQFAGRQAPGGY
ncbi:MAG: lipase family protein [Segniliparus sp.]|uniref:lipase family protein n=1 Tax=Segniliparus sp. TaxID=2804064 RepID=UPI003F3504FD